MAINSLPDPIVAIDPLTNQVQPTQILPVQIPAPKASGFWCFIRQARTDNPHLGHTYPTYWGKDAYLLEQIRGGACHE